MDELRLFDADDRRVEPIWRKLEVEAAPTYFLSWGWIENWLACLPRDEAPQLAVIGDDDAAFFLGKRRQRRHVALTSRALFLNATGVSARDELCIEHNGILRAPGSSVSLEAVLEALPKTWDELVLPAIDRVEVPELVALDPLRYRVRIEREVAAPFVDLARVRAHAGGYLALLSRSTRSQLRRARREVGELTVELAADDRQATEIYNELVRLHAQRWHRRGERGAFADPWVDQFHRRLIAQRLRHGEIQLMRVRADGETIGCLYNFVHRGRVLFYQSGLAQFSDPHIKPGYLCHAAAVEHNAALGHDVYDLLGGDARYKQSLSTSATRVVWVRVQRRLARFSVEDRLRGWKHALIRWRQRILPSGVPSRA